MQFVEVTDAHGAVCEPRWLAAAERVHRQLRERLPAGYAARMAQVFSGGARMLVAGESGEVRALALWRLIENTYEGRRLYVDDLVTDAAHRGRGLGGALLGALEARARLLGCDVLALDSGVQRADAHRFYMRAGMSIASFSFRKTLS